MNQWIDKEAFELAELIGSDYQSMLSFCGTMIVRRNVSVIHEIS